MFVDLTLIAFIVLSALAFVLVVGRKLAIISSVDVKAIPEQKAGALKNQLIEERFSRGSREVFHWLRRWLRPVQKVVGRQYTKVLERLKALEEKYSLPADRSRIDDSQQSKVVQLLNEARAFVDEKKLAEAEKKCLEVISLSQYEASAYRLLADVYLQQKQYGQAKEIFEFLLKLNVEDPEAHQGLGRVAVGAGEYQTAEAEYQKSLALADQASVHLDLADVYQTLGEREKALAACRDALAIEPRNPKILDAFCSLAIECGNREYARDALARLKDVNPENQKLTEFAERLEQLKKKR